MALDLQERDRRYGIIKEKMSARGLDALIVINSAQINEKGFVRYLTNYRSVLYNLVAIVPLDGEADYWRRAPCSNTGPLFWVGSPTQKFRFRTSTRAS